MYIETDICRLNIFSDGSAPEKPRTASDKSEATEQDLPPRTEDLEPVKPVKHDLGAGNIQGMCQL